MGARLTEKKVHWEDEGVNGKLYDYKMGLNNRALKDITFI